MKRKIILFISLFLCMVISFNSAGFALETSEDSIFVDKITINPRHGIVKGQSSQLTATISPDDVSSRMVEWSSSNEGVISCTKEGLIKGVSANGYADITCKARFGDAKDTIRIYCAESIGGYYRDDLTDWFVQIYDQPETGVSSTLYFNYTKLMTEFMEFWMGLLSKAPISLLPILRVNDISAGPCEVRGRYGKFAYVVVYTESGGADGFVKFTKLKKASSYFLSLSAEDIDVWANGYSYPHRKLTTQYKGTVKWDVADDTIVDFNDETGQITAYKPGRTTITATAGDMKRTCTIHALYRWPQQWTAKTNQDTSLYKAKGTGYVVSRDLAAGKNFVVWGDVGSSEGWAYGNIEGTDYWGYVPISHISTKGTISQYNKLDWCWPVSDIKNGTVQVAKPTYISSPYGWRKTRPKRHQGIDITTGNEDEIANYEVVSAFNGTVVFCCDDYGFDWGYCVAIRSDEKDPVTGLPYVAVYMHLMDEPKVSENQRVVAGKTLLGYVGNTTTPGENMGYHLHFEFNNLNSSIGLSGDSQIVGEGRKSYDYLVNPIFVYMDEYYSGQISYNEESESEKYYMKTFWYGNGKTLNEAS